MSSSDDIKSSAHVWGGNNGEPNQDLPPAYSGDSESGPALPSRRRGESQRRPYDPIKALIPLSSIPFSRYNIPDASLSADQSTVTTSCPQFLLSEQALLNFVMEQVELPPIPSLRIVGTHIEAGYGTPKTDFDLTLNLMNLIDLSGSRWRIKSAEREPLPGSSSANLDRGTGSQTDRGRVSSWTTRFCKEKAENKSFIITRSIPHLPAEIIEGQIRTLLASLKYRGRVVISFPLHHSKVVVIKKPSNWFVNMLGIYPEKKFDVIETIWDVSSTTEGTGSTDPAANASGLAKDWWSSWQHTLRNGILTRRTGKLGIDDWMETQTGFHASDPLLDWGKDYS